jgi:photosystem II stability/assembly factor-like uncharacterized protein
VYSALTTRGQTPDVDSGFHGSNSTRRLLWPGKCGYSHVISVDPLDANTLFCRRRRGRILAMHQLRIVTDMDQHDSDCECPSRPSRAGLGGESLINGNDGGVWSTVDLGATWQNHNRSLPMKMFYGGALHPTDSSFAIGSSRDFRLSVYRGDVGWRVLTQPRGEGVPAISLSRPDTDWMTSWLRGLIQRTTDGGQTVLQVEGDIDKTGVPFVAAIEKCQANDNVFLIGTNRVWRTNNFFNSSMPSWTANSPAHPYQFPNALVAPGTILSIAYIETDRGCNSYAFGNRGGEVRLTRDGGSTWTDLDPSKTLPARPNQ